MFRLINALLQSLYRWVCHLACFTLYTSKHNHHIIRVLRIADGLLQSLYRWVCHLACVILYTSKYHHHITRVLRIADGLLQSLYRWVCHPASALRDPALQTALQTLMAKLFAQVGFLKEGGDPILPLLNV
jgi:hypothetical protein